MILYDCLCDKCKHTWEDWVKDHDAPPCPSCGSVFTSLLPGGSKSEKAKEPYDYLDRGPPDSKRIFSGPKVHSK